MLPQDYAVLPPPKPNTLGSYDYGQVLGLSFLFYEAQRSGDLDALHHLAEALLDVAVDHHPS